MKKTTASGIAIMLVGMAILFFVIFYHGSGQITATEAGMVALAMMVLLVGFLVTVELYPKSIQYRDFIIILSQNMPELPKPNPLPISRKFLTERERSDKEKYVGNRPTPGGRAGELNVLTDLGDMPSIEIMPQSNNMVPMYLLDKHFRILDWNDALNLAFDRTMEGQRNKNALEWVMFMDNFNEVYDHGVRVFSNTENRPIIDVEELIYTSGRYGRIRATKRAYQIPDDTGVYAGWLVIVDPHFENEGYAIQFQNDLIEILRKNLIWSEYAVYYDAVLTNTTVYPELISVILGEQAMPATDTNQGMKAFARRFGVDIGEPRTAENNGSLSLTPIPANARVLDLGAGTGNITMRLADVTKGRVVVAVENNRAMLRRLKTRCAPYLRDDDHRPGVLVIKQDITSLNGFNNDYFDYAILNNVLYSVEDPLSVLKEVNRVLKPGGEIRISGPKKQTNLDKLFRRIKSDLVEAGRFEALQKDFEHVESINKIMLLNLIQRYDIKEVKEMVEKAGFQLEWETEHAYEGQAMIVAARKPLI